MTTQPGDAFGLFAFGFSFVSSANAIDANPSDQQGRECKTVSFQLFLLNWTVSPHLRRKCDEVVHCYDHRVSDCGSAASRKPEMIRRQVLRSARRRRARMIRADLCLLFRRRGKDIGARRSLPFLMSGYWHESVWLVETRTHSIRRRHGNQAGVEGRTLPRISNASGTVVTAPTRRASTQPPCVGSWVGDPPVRDRRRRQRRPGADEQGEFRQRNLDFFHRGILSVRPVITVRDSS